MKFLLRLFELKIASIDSLKLDDRDRLSILWSQLKGLTTVAGVKFFGSGERLKPIESVDQLVKEFGKRKVESYTFADAKNEEDAKSRWSVGIRRTLVTVSLVYELSPDRFDTLTSELITLNEILLASIGDCEVAVPFSFLEVPGVKFKLPRPPRFFGRIAKNSLVDVIHLKSVYKPEEQEIVNQLKEADPFVGVQRVFKGDLLRIKWGDLKQQPAEAILAQRYSWYAERGNLAVDSSFNSNGDKEFALLDAKPTQELTTYSSFSKKGTKGLVFDKPEEVTELLKSLHGILEAGMTVEGYPVDEISLVLPSRESAIDLRPLASRYGMQVVYVGNDDKLWNPFPLEYEAV